MRIMLASSMLCRLERARFEAACARYTAYCAAHGLEPLDRSSLCLYLETLLPVTRFNPFRNIVTNLRRLFVERGLPDPFTTPAQVALLRQIYRRARPSQAQPILSPRAYHKTLDNLPNTPVGVRDAALFGLIYAGRLSGYDIQALDPDHVTFSAAGLRAHLPAAPKRAPLVLRRFIDPAYCPVALLERWFRLTNYEAPGFRVVRKTVIKPTRLSYIGVASTVRRRLRAIGETSGAILSLKGTMIVVAAMRGADESSIRAQGGCRSTLTIVKWKRRGHLGSVNPTQRLGL